VFTTSQLANLNQYSIFASYKLLTEPFTSAIIATLKPCTMLYFRPFLFHRRTQRAVTSVVMLSLVACGGLPKGGERAPSTTLKGNEGTSLAATVRPAVAAHPGQSGLHALPDGRAGGPSGRGATQH